MNISPGQAGARIPLSGKMILTTGIAALIIFLCLGGFLPAAPNSRSTGPARFAFEPPTTHAN